MYGAVDQHNEFANLVHIIVDTILKAKIVDDHTLRRMRGRAKALPDGEDEEVVLPRNLDFNGSLRSLFRLLVQYPY